MNAKNTAINCVIHHENPMRHIAITPLVLIFVHVKKDTMKKMEYVLVSKNSNTLNMHSET